MITICGLATTIAASKEVKNLTEIKSKINSKKKQINQLKGQEKKVAMQLFNLDKQIDNETQLLRNVNYKITQQIKDFNKTRLKIKQQHAAIKSQTEALKKQLKSAFLMRNTNPLKLFLNQENADRLTRMAVYYDYINKWHLSKLEALMKNLMKLNILEQKQKEQSAYLTATKAQREAKKVSLDKLHQERATFLAKIKQEVVSEKSNLAKLEEDERRLVRLVNSVQRKEPITKDEYNVSLDNSVEFKQLRGKLPWPLPVKTLEAKNNQVIKHMGGVLIEASEGDQIRSVAGGEVMYSDWLRGYGLLMIINHGNDYLTLYAFNQTLIKKKGQKVAAGEVIAKVGSSGGKFVSRLYFSIRKGSMPEDPYIWLLH